MVTNITIITEIQTKPRPRATSFGGFTRIYTPKTALTYERYIASEYQRQGGFYYQEKPLIINIDFYFQPPKLPKYKQKFIDRIPCMNHKDIDNLVKSVLDALNTVAYKDDKQVISISATKHYTDRQERINIQICDVEYNTDKELKELYKQWPAKN